MAAENNSGGELARVLWSHPEFFSVFSNSFEASFGPFEVTLDLLFHGPIIIRRRRLLGFVRFWGRNS